MHKIDKTLSKKVVNMKIHTDDGCKKCETCKCKNSEEHDAHAVDKKKNVGGSEPRSNPSNGIESTKID